MYVFDEEFTACYKKKPCQNGGTCINAGWNYPNSYSCNCPQGYRGRHCEQSKYGFCSIDLTVMYPNKPCSYELIGNTVEYTSLGYQWEMLWSICVRKIWSSFIIKENYAFYTICSYLIMMLLHALCLYMYGLKNMQNCELWTQCITRCRLHKTQFVWKILWHLTVNGKFHVA